MKILYFVLLLSIAIRVNSQSTLPLRADTILIEKVGGNANLKIKDASRDTLGGVLTNIGGGVYRGKKPRKLTDSSFVIGNDTIIINGISKLIAANGVRKIGDTIKAGNLKGVFNDSSIIFYMPTRAINGARFNQLVVSNVGADSIPSVYQAQQGTQGIEYNPQQILVIRKYNEATNDTLNTLQYGGAVTAYDEWRADSASTRFKYNNKQITLPNKGFNSTNRFYPPRDSVNVFTGNDGIQGSSSYDEFSIGDTWGYNMYFYNNTLPTYPMAINASKLDLQRNLSRGRIRKITGTGIASYFANFKNYQGSISSGTTEEGAYHSKYYGFFAAGEKDDYGTSATKAKVLRVAKVDTAVAFHADPQRTSTNSVNNGLAFVSTGDDDGNYIAGRQRISGAYPTRENGWLPYNLEVIGSTRSDTIYNLYQKFDTTGRMIFATKNKSFFDAGGFSKALIDMRATIDSLGDGVTVPQGAFIFRNFTDYKTSPTAFNSLLDARVYFNLSTNRIAEIGQCADCPNHQFYGYSRIVLAAGARLSTGASLLPHTIFFARNELTGVSNGHASTLDLASFGAVFQPRTIDTLRSYLAFVDYGLSVNGISRIGQYASFRSDVGNLPNADSTWGFLQTVAGVRNKFLGTMELPSLSLVNDTTNYKVVVADINGKLFKGNWSGSGGGGGVTDHGARTGLGDDDHTQYALLDGRSGGQTFKGGTGTTDDLVLQSTAGVGTTGSDIIFKGGNNGATEFARFLNNGRFGLGTSTPAAPFNLATSGQLGAQIDMSNTTDGTYAINFNRASTSVENIFNWSTNGTANWAFGQDNDGTNDLLFYSWVANKFVFKAFNSTGDISFGNSLNTTIANNGTLTVGNTANINGLMNVTTNVGSGGGSSVVFDKGISSNQFYLEFRGNSSLQGYIGQPSSTTNRLDLGTGSGLALTLTGTTVNAPSLAGTGNRIVTANASGDLSATNVLPNVYTALLTQSGTSAPSATVLGTNTIGSIVWTRSSAGVYVGTLSGAFTANKTWSVVGWSDESAGNNIVFRLKRTGNNTVELLSTSDGVNGGDVFTNLSVRIEVYP